MPSSKAARRVSNPPAERPLLVYDGDCNFCMRWIQRWKMATGPNVDYSPFQEVGDRFPEIPRVEYESAVQWIEPDGRHLQGADAVFRLFDFAQIKRPFVNWLSHLPGVMPLARAGYRVIASHRMLFSRLTRLVDRQ
jgi:predicted DCC family thiol-disulfide oxidoreductase YuxK